MSNLYLGVMSGTSLDGIDIALIEQTQATKYLDSIYLSMPNDLRQELLDLCNPNNNEIMRMNLAAQKWVHLVAFGVQQILQRHNLSNRDIAAIGSHGQTIRHHPELGFSVQIGAPALLAELCQIKVVSDFRSRDLAAGGQGAPLAPFFHQHLFGHLAPNVAILNIGGFANLTLLNKNDISGCDTGPGNVLLDLWAQQNLSLPFDQEGKWAASGKVCTQLLEQMLLDPFFNRTNAKSTGRELFNLDWLNEHLSRYQMQINENLTAQDVQATLIALTATSIIEVLKQKQPHNELLLVCGGGVHNSYLMQYLAQLLPNSTISSTAKYGINPDLLEACAFAYFAYCCLHNIAANCPNVTSAKGKRILGAIYPA